MNMESHDIKEPPERSFAFVIWLNCFQKNVRGHWRSLWKVKDMSCWINCQKGDREMNSTLLAVQKGMTYQEALRKEVTERQIEVAGEFILLVEAYRMSRLEKEKIIG